MRALTTTFPMRLYAALASSRTRKDWMHYRLVMLAFAVCMALLGVFFEFVLPPVGTIEVPHIEDAINYDQWEK